MHPRASCLAPVHTARRLGQIGDQPRGDHRVIGRVVRVEKALGGLVRIVVSSRRERSQHLPELRKRHRDVRARRLGD